jgi:hypothetical protein
MDCAKVRGAVPSLIPSIAMACVSVASARDMVTFTWDMDELPGQSTLKTKRVEITSDTGVFLLLSPGAEAPLKYETLPRSSEALPGASLCSIAPVDAARIVMIGAPVTDIGGGVRRLLDGCPNAGPFTSGASIHTENRVIC